MSMVCWSGGADSTLVLYDRLVRFRDRKDTDRVRVVSVRNGGLYADKQQRRARVNIRRALKRRGLTFEHTEVTLKDRGDFDIDQRGLVQPIMWLGTVMPYLSLNEKLYMGYIKGDCVLAWWEQLHSVFNNAAQMLNIGDASLEVPLFGVSKAQVLKRLKDAGLFGMTWTCENPRKSGKACGRCPPCKHLILAKYELRRWPEA